MFDHRHPCFLLLWTAACAGPDKGTVEPTTGIDGSTASHETSLTDTTQPTDPTTTQGSGSFEPVVEEEHVEPPADPARWIFSNEHLHEIAIELPGPSYEAIRVAPYEYATGTVTIDGIVVQDVGLRIRGKLGSFREIEDKPKWRIDFNRYTPGREFFGLEALSLNNSVADCSFLREAIAFRVFEAAGAPTSRLSFAHVTLNGVDNGLYQVLEVQDDRWLDRIYEDSSGNLYDGKYVYYGGWDYDLVDFADWMHDGFQLEEGADVGRADIYTITSSLTAGPDDWYDTVGSLVDLPKFNAFLAAEQWTGHVDGYAMNQNNYRVYFDPTTGLARFHTTDLDNGFTYDWMWGMSWSYPRGYVAGGCWNDPLCNDRQREAVRALLERLQTVDLDGLLTEYDLLTRDAAEADPWAYWCGIEDTRSELRRWVGEREGELRTFWGL